MIRRTRALAHLIAGLGLLLMLGTTRKAWSLPTPVKPARSDSAAQGGRSTPAKKKPAPLTFASALPETVPSRDRADAPTRRSWAAGLPDNGWSGDDGAFKVSDDGVVVFGTYVVRSAFEPLAPGGCAFAGLRFMRPPDRPWESSIRAQAPPMASHRCA